MKTNTLNVYKWYYEYLSKLKWVCMWPVQLTAKLCFVSYEEVFIIVTSISLSIVFTHVFNIGFWLFVNGQNLMTLHGDVDISV